MLSTVLQSVANDSVMGNSRTLPHGRKLRGRRGGGGGFEGVKKKIEGRGVGGGGGGGGVVKVALGMAVLRRVCPYDKG